MDLEGILPGPGAPNHTERCLYRCTRHKPDPRRYNSHYPHHYSNCPNPTPSVCPTSPCQSFRAGAYSLPRLWSECAVRPGRRLIGMPNGHPRTGMWELSRHQLAIIERSSWATESGTVGGESAMISQPHRRQRKRAIPSTVSEPSTRSIPQRRTPGRIGACFSFLPKKRVLGGRFHKNA